MLHSRMLQYLDEVVRQGSIRKAADRLHVAPSAISRQILALEQSLGIDLFDRSEGRLKPTAAGELLVQHARETIKEMARTRGQIEQLKGLRKGVVTIGLMSGLAADIVPRAIVAFHIHNPRLEVKPRLMSTGDEILNAMAKGEIDLGFGFDFEMRPAVRLLHSVTAPLGAVMTPDHPLAHAEVLRLGDCAAYPLVLADHSMALRPYIDRALERSKLELRANTETNSIEMMRSLALLGSIAFLTPFDIKVERRGGRLVHIPVLELATHSQQLMLVEDRRRSNVLGSLFSEAIKANMNETDVPLPG